MKKGVCFLCFDLHQYEKCSNCGMQPLVRIRFAILRVFALLSVVGLVLAPIARPVMAMPAAIHVTTGEPVASNTRAVAADEMPCCPGKPSVPDCDKDCPFAALCGAMALHNVSQASLIIPFAHIASILPDDPSALTSLAHAPPRKPPKA